jgi:DNA primase
MQMPSTEQRNYLDLATMTYMDHLDLALPYLEKRGIGEDLARLNGLGVVADPLQGHEKFRNRLAIPYLTRSGPINMKFRCIKDHNCKEQSGHSKYISYDGLKGNLFGVMAYEDAGNFMCITEGELDTLILQSIGLPSMGVPGATHWQNHWNEVFRDFSRIYIFSDGDEAGQLFAGKVQVNMPETAVNVPMPEGMDVTDVYVAQGPQVLTNLIKESK